MASAVELRAARHAALGDPVRLAIIDELAVSDFASVELQRRFRITSNLLAHHLDVLEDASLITRSRSSGDGRRRYVHLHRRALAELQPGRRNASGSVRFVCTQNSARSQLAAALWNHLTRDAADSADSAGTHPADAVHPGAIAAAQRAGLNLNHAAPRDLADLRRRSRVVTVCDRAHEELDPGPDWLHWSVTDPVAIGSPAAFDATVAELHDRVRALVDCRSASS